MACDRMRLTSSAAVSVTVHVSPRTTQGFEDPAQLDAAGLARATHLVEQEEFRSGWTV